MAKYVKVRYVIEGYPENLAPDQFVKEFEFHIDINEQIKQVYKVDYEALDSHPDELVSISLVDKSVLEVTLRIPIPNAAGNECLLFILSLILGNIIRGATFTRIQLQELKFPDDVMEKLPGPGLGVDGIRSFLDSHNSIILSAPLAAYSNNTAESVSRALDLVKAGISLISDSPARYYSSVIEYTDYAEAFVEAVASAGLRAICFVNGNFGLRYLNKAINKLEKLSNTLGWPIGLRIDPMLIGLVAMEQVRRTSLPLFCYSQFNRLLSSSSAGITIPVLTKLLRAIGADIIVVGTGEPATFDNSFDIHASINSMLKPLSFQSKKKLYKIPETLPIVTGGLTPRLAHQFAQKYSTNIGFHIGKGILTGPLSLTDNVFAFLEGIQAGLNKIPYDDFIQMNKGAKYLAKYERAINQNS